MTISVFELISLIFGLIGSVWAIAATIYRPPKIDLTLIYTKLDSINQFLYETRADYLPRKEFTEKCSICKQEHTKDIAGIHDRIDEAFLNKKPK